EQLVPRHPGDGTPQNAGSREVLLDQCVVVHGVILTGWSISCGSDCPYAAMRASSSVALIHSSSPCPHTLQFLVHCSLIESLRVEFATYPFQQFIVPAMVRVAYRFHEVSVGPGTAAVFGRARSLTSHADGILHSLFGQQSLLHDELMYPFIPKVVLVGEPRA